MSSPEPSWLLQIGDLFADRYEVRAVVGHGAHGAVFEALDKNDASTVALKVIHPELMGENSEDNLFLLRRSLAYRSDELVPLRDILEIEDKTVLVQPYVSAPNLRTHLQLKTDSGESFDALSGLKMLTDIAGGLSWVHRFGPHGNIKPENIFVTGEGYRLHDAYRLDGIQRLSWAPDNPWTKDAYQAPEQYGGTPSLATDTYAFAIVIGEALAGKPVKDGIPLSAQSSLVSFKDFDELFLASTSRNPDERPSTDEFVSEAGKVLSSAGESEAGAKPDMNITLVTGIPVISDSMMKDLEDGFSAKEVLAREEERTDADDEEPGPEPEADKTPPPLTSPLPDEGEDLSLIGGEPLGVDFGVIVGRAISTVLSEDVNAGRPRGEQAEDTSEDGNGFFEPSSSTKINPEDAQAMFASRDETDPYLPPIPPALPPMGDKPVLEDASVLEMLPDDSTPSPEDEEAEVYAESDEKLAGDGGMGGLIDLDEDADADDAELIELSSDALTVEEVSPSAARRLEEQLTVEPLGEARDLVSEEPAKKAPARRLGDAIDPTALPTQVTRRRGVRESAYASPAQDISTSVIPDSNQTPAPFPWYLAVAGAGALAFVVVWFMATPSTPEPAAPEPAANPTTPTKTAETPSGDELIPAKAEAPPADPATAAVPKDVSTGEIAAEDAKLQPVETTTSPASAGDSVENTGSATPVDTHESEKDAGTAQEPDVAEPEPSMANLPTPTTCREGYAEIPGTDAFPRFYIQILEYHGGEKRPLRKVKYDDAVEKCAAESGRLCTADEFSAACGGTYPYGDRFIRKKCNVMGSFFEARPVRPGGSFPACKSPLGVMDLSGNVAEWVEGALVAGGSSSQEGKSVACSRAVKRKPNRPSRSTGFRCCHNLQ